MVYGIDMEEKPSPEERLLRLIRGEKRTRPISSTPPKEVDKIKRQVWIQRFGSLKFTNQILFIFLLISLAYLILNFIIVRHPQSQVPLSPPQKAQKTEEETFELKPYSYYLEGIQKRELFGTSELRPPVEGAERQNSEAELTNLNLIGIVSGTNPQAIIEEKKTNKTYFLNKGDYIGQFKVESILPGKVILTYDGQVYELNL